MQGREGNAMRKLAYGIGFAAAALLAACGGGGDGPLPKGTLQLSLTDAPACYRNVEITVEKVRVHKGSNVGDNQEGWVEIVPPNAPVKIDLLELTNGAIADLGSADVDVGIYRDMRLVLSDEAGANTVTLLDGTVRDLKTPSGQASGIKLRTSITVEENETTDVLLDFDACKSVVAAGGSGQYILKPVIRLSDKVAGGIQGYVDPDLVASGQVTAVTAYRDGEAVRATTPADNGKFKLAWLVPGTYTVVITSTARATGVVTGVPVESSVVTIAGTGSRIALPASTTHIVRGTVKAGGTPVTDAFVTARQAIAGGSIDVLSTPVNYVTGAYELVLPEEPAQVAAYDPSGLSFADDLAADGYYTLRATAPGRGALTEEIDTREPSPMTIDFVY